ncbi:MAG: hypothetical protein ACMUIP_17255, partial [bacterium]
MKKIKGRPFLIFLCLSVFLLAGTLKAAPLDALSFISANSQDSFFTGWDTWTPSSLSAPVSQAKASAFSSNMAVTTSIWPAASTKSISSIWDWPVTAPSWSTSSLSVPVRSPSFEIYKSIWPLPTTSSLASLWDWPATPPAWNTNISDWTSITKPDDSEPIGNAIPPAVAYDFDQLWKQIDEAIGKGLPQTAIGYLKELIPKALELERYGIAMKAISKQLVLEANIQGNKPEEKITRLTEEIEKAPELLKPLLKLVLAQWYWHYYQNNRWRFSQRDTTLAIDDKDLTTWDLPRIFNTIDGLYTEALSQEELLKSTSMLMFTDFFTLGTVPLSYRPTLYDFAAFAAISFYQDGDQIRNEPEDAFELDADSDAFAAAKDFIKYMPETTDTSSPILK